MDICVHVGMHRTGSASLHHWLDWQREALAARGVTLCLPPQQGLTLTPPPRAAAAAPDHPGAAGRVVAALARLERGGTGHMILSSPDLAGAPEDCLATPRLYPDFAARMAALAQTLGPEVSRVGLSIRSYDGFWSSLLTAAVQRGTALPARSLLDRMVTQPRRWRTLIDEAAAAFPQAQVVVWPFERLAGRPDRQLDLLTGRRMGGPGQPGTSPWLNRSPGRDQLRHDLREGGRDWQAIPMGDGRWMPFDLSQITTLRDQYSADLAWLRAGAEGRATLDEGIGAPEATGQVPVAI